MCNHVNIATIVQKKHSVVRLLMLNKYGYTHLVIERLVDLSIFGRHLVSASTKTEKSATDAEKNITWPNERKNGRPLKIEVDIGQYNT